MKKFLSLALIAVLGLGVLTGCASKDSVNEDVYTDEVVDEVVNEETTDEVVDEVTVDAEADAANVEVVAE